MRLTIGSLFSGIGGLYLGLEWAGLGPVIWQVEADPFCRAVLAKHWPDAQRFDDVRTVGAANLAPVDVICGGFPCQDISDAGKRVGIEGERSGLWCEYARIVGELRPRLIIVENVAALLGRGALRVLGDLAALGFDAEWGTLRAADVGAPHRRARTFLVAYANGQWELQSAGTQPEVWRRAGHGSTQLGNAESIRCRGSGPNGERSSASNRIRPCVRHASGDGRRSAQPCLGRSADGLPPRVDRWPAGRGEAQHDWEPPRTTTQAENRAARLKALGNAVVPQCAYIIGLSLIGGAP